MSAALRRLLPLVYWIRVLDSPSTERIIYDGRLHFTLPVIKRRVGGMYSTPFPSLPFFSRESAQSAYNFFLRHTDRLIVKQISRKSLRTCELNIFKLKASSLKEREQNFTFLSFLFLKCIFSLVLSHLKFYKYKI